ncbi:hypothetical protein FRB94_013520 [Tulasnella sp. JGI-2019a]|nr:hypothetical protein FRB93_005133 [Tulasnella sp. JGI-2019a]KAG9014210.1 hypothetical protein FRB94_013520 [Tulasnella sp. JGI-2019a]KAG9035931.1 hypothetical protein FRB95_010139 [Tulasnella sp. JGI-2019a]
MGAFLSSSQALPTQLLCVAALSEPVQNRFVVSSEWLAHFGFTQDHLIAELPLLLFFYSNSTLFLPWSNGPHSPQKCPQSRNKCSPPSSDRRGSHHCGTSPWHRTF